MADAERFTAYDIQRSHLDCSMVDLLIY
jgi:hypothetical protein